ncbi:MAG TPA: glycoside hydrolase family 20 zincin-like fold domain-containing protein, partial [Mucilaginibacter sp.]|nr:glycoside hydrolase family 20 zincin-like fold domain-containing protein [Mucilaginibacter sp.]
MKKITFLAVLLVCHFAVIAQENTLNLMPMPRQVIAKAGSFRISNKFTIRVQGNANDTILYDAVNRAYQALNRKTGLIFGQKYITSTDTITAASMTVMVKTKTSPAIGADESYSLQVDEKQIVLNATSTPGALYGLQTLVQLLGKDDNGYYLPCVT